MIAGPTVVSRRGQITIPAAVRRALDINEGDRVVDAGEVRLTPLSGGVARTAGALKGRGPALTAEQERAAFEQAVAEEVMASMNRPEHPADNGMAAPPIHDPNVLLRRLLQDHDDHAARATSFLARVKTVKLTVRVTYTTVFETVFTGEKICRRNRAAIRQTVLPLVLRSEIVLPHKPRLSRAFDLYGGGRLSYADADHAVLAGESEPHEIISFVRGSDQVPGLRRTEP